MPASRHCCKNCWPASLSAKSHSAFGDSQWCKLIVFRPASFARRGQFSSVRLSGTITSPRIGAAGRSAEACCHGIEKPSEPPRQVRRNCLRCEWEEDRGRESGGGKETRKTRREGRRGVGDDGRHGDTRRTAEEARGEGDGVRLVHDRMLQESGFAAILTSMARTSSHCRSKAVASSALR